MPFNLDDYVPVAERLVAFYGEYPKGSIQTDIIELSDKRVVMRATVYRDPTDERPSIAHSALSIPGTTQFTRGSEIENAETSAIGRAIAMLGFEVKRGVASREEVRNKQDEEPKPKAKPDEATAARLAGHDPGGIVGVIEESKAWAPHYAPKIDPVHGFDRFKIFFNVLQLNEHRPKVLLYICAEGFAKFAWPHRFRRSFHCS